MILQTGKMDFEIDAQPVTSTEPSRTGDNKDVIENALALIAIAFEMTHRLGLRVVAQSSAKVLKVAFEPDISPDIEQYAEYTEHLKLASPPETGTNTVIDKFLIADVPMTDLDEREAKPVLLMFHALIKELEEDEQQRATRDETRRQDRIRFAKHRELADAQLMLVRPTLDRAQRAHERFEALMRQVDQLTLT